MAEQIEELTIEDVLVPLDGMPDETGDTTDIGDESELPSNDSDDTGNTPKENDPDEPIDSTADEPHIPSIGDVLPVLSDIDPTLILHPPQIPDGYSVVQYDDGVYIVFDEDGVLLGFFILPEGVPPEEFDIMDGIIPFGVPEFDKQNPQTIDQTTSGGLSVIRYAGETAILLLLFAPLFRRRRRTKTSK